MSDDEDKRRHRETRRHLRRSRRMSTWLLAGLGALIVLVVVLGVTAGR